MLFLIAKEQKSKQEMGIKYMKSPKSGDCVLSLMLYVLDQIHKEKLQNAYYFLVFKSEMSQENP